MSEEKYRLAVVMLLSVLVIAVIVLGALSVQNGRYVQYDHQKDHVVLSNGLLTPPHVVFDSRTGKKVDAE